MNIRPSKSTAFLLWLALAALVVILVAAGLRDTLTDDDRQAIDRMLDGATPTR